MATMSGEIYDAFVEAGASPDKARKAAETIAHLERDSAGRQADLSSFRQGVDQNLVGFRGDISAFRHDVDQRFAAFRNEVDQRFTKVDGELTLLKWMVGVNTAAVMPSC